MAGMEATGSSGGAGSPGFTEEGGTFGKQQQKWSGGVLSEDPWSPLGLGKTVETAWQPYDPNQAAATMGAGGYWGERGRGYAGQYRGGIGQGERFVSDQQRLIAALQDPQGPSVAETFMQRGREQRLQAQVAAMRSQRGMAPVQATRMIGQQAGRAQQEFLGQMGTLRAQEEIARQGLLGQVIGGARGQDVQTAQMYSELTQYYESMGYNAAEAEQAARMQLEEIKSKQAIAAAKVATAEAERGQTASGGPLAAVGTLFSSWKGGKGGSDERMKQDIKDDPKGVDKFLDALKAKRFRYADPVEPGAAEGEHLGVMAQDLEKSELGRLSVVERGGRKMVDLTKALMSTMAGAARLNERVRTLEEVLGHA